MDGLKLIKRKEGEMSFWKKLFSGKNAVKPSVTVMEGTGKPLESLGILELGILFDIDELSGGFYGNKAWRIFMKNCNSKKLCDSTLFEGDTSGTLAGRERIFCIAVQTFDSSSIIHLKESFKICQEKGLLPPDGRFIEGNVTDTNSLLIRGRIDSIGRFVTDKWTRVDEDLCKECGWEYAPL